MKLFRLFFIVTIFATRPSEAILVLKHVRCLEALDNSQYDGNRCTVSNISLPETSYNWGGVTHSELHFSDSVVPLFPDRLVSMMKQFVVLNMTNVQLKMLTTSNFQDSGNLRELYLKGNELKILTNYTFNHSSSLEVLDLSYNGIEMIQVETFHNMKNLKKLDLSHNHLMSIGLEFQDLISLFVLDLSHNQLQGLHLNAINTLTNINTLNLESNHLLHFRLNLCNEFNLKLLLSDNGMETIVLTWNPMSRMGQENELEIMAANNRIVRLATDKEINLVHVDLQRNGLSSIRGMKNLKQLSKLNLAGNKISEVKFEMLNNLTTLRELNISFNAIKTLDVSDVCEHLPSLKWLGLRGNLWDSCEYLSDIVSVLKTSHIAYDMKEGEGELECVVIETEESTERDDEVTTEKTNTSTDEPLPTTPIHDDDDNSDGKNPIWEFFRADFLRILVAILLILGIIAVIVRMCLDCKRGKVVDISSANYANVGTRM